MNKSSRMRRAGHVAQRGEKRNGYKVMEDLKERRHLEDLETDNIHMDPLKLGWELWTGCAWFRTGTSGWGR
jgi:hypothetical protein